MTKNGHWKKIKVGWSNRNFYVNYSEIWLTSWGI